MPRTSNKPRRPEIPTTLLSELASSSASGVDSRGSPYSRPSKGGKPHMSRKDARKQQREEKKQRKATHHARMHEKPGRASATAAQGKGKDAGNKPVVTEVKPLAGSAASGDGNYKSRDKQHQQKQQAKLSNSDKKATHAKNPELTDQEKMLKLAKKDPALLARLRSQGLIPSTAGLSDGEMGRDETIDRMDIARYEKLLKLNKRKRKNKKKAADGEEGQTAAEMPTSVPKSIAHDGLGDLFAMVGGVTSKGDVSVIANPTVHVDSDGEEVDEEDDEELGGGDMYADAMGDENESGSDEDPNEAAGEDSDEDSMDTRDADLDRDQEDESDSDLDDQDDDDDDDDDKYLVGLGLDDLEGMLGGDQESSDDESSSGGDNSDDEMKMDSDLEAEMHQLLARPEYAEAGLDSFGDDSESDSAEASEGEQESDEEDE